MKKLKLNFAMMAAVLGLTAAFAFKPAPQAKTADVLWGRDESGNWHNIDGMSENYSCTTDDAPCKARFPQGVTPVQNQQPASGNVEQDNGYITL